MLLQAVLLLGLVLERLYASFIKLYMFYFDWPQPIFLSLEMVVLFFGYSLIAVAAGSRLAKLASVECARIWTAAKWAMCINIGGMIVVVLMVITRLAVLTGKL